MISIDKEKQNNPYRPWQLRILISTWLAYAGYYFCRKAFYVVKADMGMQFSLSSVDIAHLGTAYLVAYAAGQFSTAYIGKRLGPKILLLAGMAISIICNFVFGISNGFWTIMLFLALNGMAQGTGWPGCIGSLAFWFKREQRGSILGVWSTCYQLGSVLATGFAAYMLGALGWRWSFFGASLVLICIWFIVLTFHPGTPEGKGLPPIEEEKDTADEGKADKDFTAEKKTKLNWSKEVVFIILAMGIIYFCIKFLRYAIWSWGTYFLRFNFHLQGDKAGYLPTLFDLAGFAGVIFAGFVSDRFFNGKRSLLCFIMLLLMSAGFILMYSFGADNLLYFSISLGITGFMLYGPDSLLSGVGAIDVGSKKGALTAAGIINGMGSVGPIFQEEIIGWMYKFYNNEILPILIMLVIIAIAGAMLTLILWLYSLKGKVKL